MNPFTLIATFITLGGLTLYVVYLNGNRTSLIFSTIILTFAFLLPYIFTSVFFTGIELIHSFFVTLYAFLSTCFGLIAAAFLSKNRPRWYAGSFEGEISNLGILKILLLLILIVGVYSNYEVYKILTKDQSISTINDINVAFSNAAEEGKSLGIVGRLSRLPISFGILAFALYLVSRKRRDKKVFLTYSILFALTLVGVKRSIIAYQLLYYVLIYIATVVRHAQLMSRLRIGIITIIPFIIAFGAIQVFTNKAGDRSIFTSAVFDSSIYIAGNVPYYECAENGGIVFTNGFSFPFIAQISEKLNQKDSKNLGKPFCNIDSAGLLFNTSPSYFDLYKDLGITAVCVFYFLIPFLIVFMSSKRRPIIGVLAMLTAVMVFSFRENLLGQYDFVFSLIVYLTIVVLWRKKRVRSIQKA